MIIVSSRKERNGIRRGIKLPDLKSSMTAWWIVWTIMVTLLHIRPGIVRRAVSSLFYVVTRSCYDPAR